MPKIRFSLNSVLLLAAIALWLVNVWYAWGYRQAGQQLTKLGDEVASQRRVLTRLQQGSDVEALRKQLATLEQELASQKLPFLQGDVSLSVADLIVQAGARSGVDLIGAVEVARDSVAVGSSKYRAIRYQLNLQGTISQLQDFLGWIETTTRDESSEFYLLRSLEEDKLKLANKGGDVWNYNLDVVVYTQL